MSTSHFTTRRRVQFSETDMAGIVHFSNFFKWMEEAEHEFFRSLGLRIMQSLPDGTVLGWPRVSVSCNYAAPAKYEQDIDIGIRVDRVGARSVTYSIEFASNGSRLATGQMKTACCICRSDGSLTSVDLPDNYRTALEHFEQRPK
jgi:YbgC/YbaW family acyl-CoA thioester hydrolase